MTETTQGVTAAQVAGDPWRDRSKQPHCPTCGRFAYWSFLHNEWRLHCVFWDDYNGGWEHE